MRKRAQALYWAAMTRDLIGYGEKPPAVTWPGGARVAVNVVINYEEGSENRVEDGQGGRESMGEAPSPVPAAQRDLANESFFEYGSRAGFWRLLRVLDAQQVTGTVFACAVAFERNPEAARAVTARGWDICAHGNRWEEHWLMDREAERARRHLDHGDLGPGSARLVLPLWPVCQYARARRRPAVVPLRQRLLCRRPAVLRPERDRALARCPLRPRHQRHPVLARHPAGGGGFRRLPLRRLRSALGGGRHPPAHDVGGAALPHRGPPRKGARAGALPRARAATGTGLVRPPQRDRAPLARSASSRPSLTAAAAGALDSPVPAILSR